MSYIQGVDEQLRIFLYSLGMGAVICIFYDILKFIRNSFAFNKILIFSCDIIFMLICSFLTFIYMLIMNNGRVRFYIISGEVFGFLIYYFTFGQLFENVFNIFKKKILYLKSKLKDNFSKLKIKKISNENFNALKNRLDTKKGS